MERFFDLVIAFLFPLTWREINWQAGYESLGTELRKVLPEAEVGKRFCDVVVKAFSHGSEEERDTRYLHAEVQCQEVGDFLNRLDDYNSLLKLKLGHPILSLVVFGDDNPVWEPNHYLYECGGFRKEITFPSAKLLRFRGQEEELLRRDNPVGLLVVAHLLTLSTKPGDVERRDGKLRLLTTVLDRKMGLDESYHISRLIDWLVELPRESQLEMWQEIQQRAREDQMPFLSYPEQVGFDKGKQVGERAGLLQGIETLLRVKFRDEGLGLLPTLRERDLPVLRQVLETLGTDSSLDEVRRLLP